MVESSKIKRIREKLGLSQEKLARLADVSNNTIINIEAGKQQNPQFHWRATCEFIISKTILLSKSVFSVLLQNRKYFYPQNDTRQRYSLIEFDGYHNKNLFRQFRDLKH